MTTLAGKFEYKSLAYNAKASQVLMVFEGRFGKVQEWITVDKDCRPIGEGHDKALQAIRTVTGLVWIQPWHINWTYDDPRCPCEVYR